MHNPPGSPRPADPGRRATRAANPAHAGFAPHPSPHPTPRTPCSRLLCPPGSERAGHLYVDHLNNWSHGTMYPAFILSGGGGSTIRWGAHAKRGGDGGLLAGHCQARGPPPSACPACLNFQRPSNSSQHPPASLPQPGLVECAVRARHEARGGGAHHDQQPHLYPPSPPSPAQTLVRVCPAALLQGWLTWQHSAWTSQRACLM